MTRRNEISFLAEYIFHIYFTTLLSSHLSSLHSPFSHTPYFAPTSLHLSSAIYSSPIYHLFIFDSSNLPYTLSTIILTHSLTFNLHPNTVLDTMSAPSFLQIQTRAAHPLRRPQTQPDKGTQVTATPSTSPSSTESSPSQSPSSDWARCSRCHRSVSVDGSLPSIAGVNFGTNSYYCQRCAKLVGYTP